MRKIAPKYKRPSFIPVQVIKFHFNLLTNVERFLLYWPWFIFFTTVFIVVVNFDKAEFLSLNIVFFGSIISILSALMGVYKFIETYLRKRYIKTEKSKELEMISENIEPSYYEEKETYEDYDFKVRGNQDDSIIMSKTVNEYLRQNSNKIKLTLENSKEKMLLDELRIKSEFHKNVLLDCHFESRKEEKMFFNEEKISLITTPIEGIKELKVYRSNYFTSYLTNDLATNDVVNYKNRSEPKRIWSGMSIFPYNSKNNRISRLEESKLSNHIGGNTIAFTQEGKMIFWRQGERAKRSVGLLTPTGSGSLDYADFKFANQGDSFLSTMVIRGMERELMEEGHKEGMEIVDFVESTKIIGYYRWVNKAGLPGFLGISKLKLGSEINPNASETDNPQWIVTTYDVFDKESLQIAIEDLLVARKSQISIPLFANLLALKQVLLEDEDYIKFIYP